MAFKSQTCPSAASDLLRGIYGASGRGGGEPQATVGTVEGLSKPPDIDGCLQLLFAAHSERILSEKGSERGGVN